MIAAVVLAAGGSRRFGEPKQLLRLGGTSLVRRAIDAAAGAGCAPVVAVLGAEAERVRRELRTSPARIAVNEGWREGLASSIRAGVAAIGGEPTVGALLLLACDQPGLDAAVVGRILASFDGAAGRIVAAEYAGTVGVPALFDRAHFSELAELRGDCGARDLVRRQNADVVRVPWPDGAIDLDRPEDYESLRGAERRGRPL